MRRQSNHHRFRYWFVAQLAPNHYLNQCWNIVDLSLRNILQWNGNQNSYISNSRNAFENAVCERAAILYRPQCVKFADFRCILVYRQWRRQGRYTADSRFAPSQSKTSNIVSHWLGANLESALTIHHDDRASRRWTTAGGWQAMRS